MMCIGDHEKELHVYKKLIKKNKCMYVLMGG